MANLTALLNRAFSAYRAGKLIEAEQLCQKIVAKKHNFFDALHLLAVVQSELGKTDQALASYNRALTLRPDHTDALSNRGNTLKALKRFDEALADYDQALTLRPDHAEALSNRSGTLYELKRFEEALASCDRALTLRPNYPEALSNCGAALFELKRFEEALASCDRALALRPNYAVALYNRGNILKALKRFEEALASYDRALTLRPDYAEALSNRGITLHELKRLDEALVTYDRALTLQPEYAQALSNRGNTLHALNRFEEALASYDRALTLRSDFAEALSNRGNTLHQLKRFEEALASYERALTVRPDYAEAHYNAALCRLLIGDFERGWNKHEWRSQTKQAGNTKRNFSKPQWLGQEDIAGKTILFHAEQGLGDAIQFCRYVPLVAKRGAHVILEVPEPLQKLLSNLTDAAQIISRGDPLPDFDFHCPLLSLPLAFGTRLATIPALTPYLHASPQVLKNWDTRLGPRTRPRIGLAWSGHPAHKNDHNRSISLGSLLSLLEINATFVSLQKDVRSGDATVLKDRNDLYHFGDELKSFSDTAALISQLDLVISVDTSVAHLAGALGKPVWVLLPFIPDWRWLLDRNDSPWYPSARLFRQDATRLWDNVIARVHAALPDFVQNWS